MNERELFMAALRIEDATARAAYLDLACAGEPALRQRVEALLAALEQAGSFLQQPVADPTATSDFSHPGPSPARDPAEGAGTLIGPYKLLEQIGEGGMGTVWMAQQTEPIKRLVAVKLIKAGMDSRQVIARFEAERQALALMDHANIARVLDGGTTAAGRPYFVMDLVKGVPITRYCDEHHLTPRQRLELFVPVCQAIQHAHQKGIIHRDLKPSNVMVALYDGNPVPKVIDFGVAKATGQQLTEHTLVTGFGAVVGTLEYMSPEQAELNQLDIDTRSDIYSLGVLLYELLTGTTPLEKKRLKQTAMLEVLRVIREEEPPRPSTRLSTTDQLPAIAANRGLEPKKLRGLVRGELDWIVMKALEKDRNRRYETANGFAMDVRRYLHDEAVLACPPSAAYRLRKFARRNKGALTTVALLGLMLLLGMVLLVVNNVQIQEEQLRTASQKTRAETALGEAKGNLQLADENLGLALEALDEVYMTEIEKRVRQKRALSPADRDFLHKGLRFYEEFGKRNSNHAGLQAATAKADRRAGYLRLELQQWQEAAVSFRKAIPLLENLATASPTAAEHRRELASARHGLAVAARSGLSVASGHTGSLAEAETVCRQAIASWQRLVAEFPGEGDYRVQLGHSLWELREIMYVQGRHQEAEGPLREALKLYEKLSIEFPRESYYRQETAFSRRVLADCLENQGRLPEAVANLQQAIALYAAMVADSPANLFFRGELAYSYHGLGNVLENSRRAKEAEDASRQAISNYEKLVQEAPKVADYRKMLAWSQASLSHVFAQAKHFAEAESHCRQALNGFKELAAEDSSEPSYWFAVARQSQALGEKLMA